MERIEVQYLLIFEKGSICSNSQSIKNLFQANSDIKIEGANLFYKETEFQFILDFKNEDDEYRYFKLDTSGQDDTSIDLQTELLREIRRLTTNNKGQIEVLSDSISFYYALKAYPLIYEVENQMRKLITLFLIDSVGINKAKNAIPIELDKKYSNNFLNQTDFIHLGEILTKEYSSVPIGEIYKKIDQAKKTNDMNLAELKAMIPKSNLDRYFKKYIDFDAEYLKKKWKRLYELRCLVAHNNFFTKTDFTELTGLITDVRLKLKNAIDRVDEIDIPKNEKDSILEFTASNSNELTGEFIQTWKTLEQKLNNFLGHKENKLSAYQCVKEMANLGFFSTELTSEFIELNISRNNIVHLTEVTFSNEEILRQIETTKRITEQIVLRDDYQDSWPFSVDKGVIINTNNSIIFRYMGNEFGLNGFALTHGYKNATEIWLDDPKIPGAKISMGPFLLIGLNSKKNRH